MKRLGIIGSSGGSALIAATHCFRVAKKEVDWVIVTDRDCGLEQWAISAGYETHQLKYSDANTFSQNACSIFLQVCCEDILLFYTRRVAAPLIEELRVWNIHPALLPAFQGFHAVEQALAANVRILGATLHRVNAGLDTGPIVAQVATALPVGISTQQAQRLSYMQKVWLTLVWFEQVSDDQKRILPTVQPYGVGIGLANPDIVNRTLRESYVEWLAQLEEENKDRLKCAL